MRRQTPFVLPVLWWTAFAPGCFSVASSQSVATVASADSGAAADIDSSGRTADAATPGASDTAEADFATVQAEATDSALATDAGGALNSWASPSGADFAVDPLLVQVASRRSLLVLLAKGASSAALTAELAPYAAKMVGSWPAARIVQLMLPETATFENRHALTEKLRAHSSVQAVAADVALHPSALPKPRITPGPPTEPPAWDWLTVSGRTWALAATGAPPAWNLKLAIERLEHPKPVVAVLEQNFRPYGDMAWSIDATPWIGDGVHGTQVASVIGAAWGNQSSIDGIVPWVTVLPIAATPKPVFSFKGLVSSMGTLLDGIIQSAQVSVPRPRIVNVSMGYNWATSCVLTGSKLGTVRCDPRKPAVIPDSACEDPKSKAAVHAQIEASGAIISAAVTAAQSGGPMLFVVAAGNDSGALMTKGSFCADGDAAGMGAFPVEMAGPLQWAAHNDLDASEHIVVAEAYEQQGKWTYARSSFSNVNHDVASIANSVFAPGEYVGVAELDADEASKQGVASGTSFAAPMVAGAAAFLLAAEPALTNDELTTLLTSSLYASDFDGGASLTQARLNLLGAALGLDAEHPNPLRPEITVLLADFDDGTPDGCQRAVYADDGSVAAQWSGADLLGDGAVDLRDFRRLRDAFYMHTGKLKPVWPDGSADTSNRWDLNLDGQIVAGKPENFPRAALNGAFSLAADATPLLNAGETSLALFAQAYTPDKAQPYDAAALEGLFASSADLIVRAGPALKTYGATELEVAFADASGSLPPSWADLASGLTGLSVAAEERVLTVPVKAEGLTLLWRPAGKPWNAVPITGLKPGEDRVVVLQNCPAPTAALKVQPKTFVGAKCMGNNPDFCVCLSCSPLAPVKLTFDASATYSTGPVSYSWAFATVNGSVTSTLPAKSKDPKGTVSFNFGTIPCGGSKGTLTATVTATNDCGASSTAKASAEITVQTQTTCF